MCASGPHAEGTHISHALPAGVTWLPWHCFASWSDTDSSSCSPPDHMRPPFVFSRRVLCCHSRPAGSQTLVACPEACWHKHSGAAVPSSPSPPTSHPPLCCVAPRTVDPALCGPSHCVAPCTAWPLALCGPSHCGHCTVWPLPPPPHTCVAPRIVWPLMQVCRPRGRGPAAALLWQPGHCPPHLTPVWPLALYGPSCRCAAPEAEGQPPPYFGSLATLYAAACGLSSWADVDELDKLPALLELRLTGNPLLGQSKTGGRFEVRARAGQNRGPSRAWAKQRPIPCVGLCRRGLGRGWAWVSVCVCVCVCTCVCVCVCVCVSARRGVDARGARVGVRAVSMI